MHWPLHCGPARCTRAYGHSPTSLHSISLRRARSGAQPSTPFPTRPIDNHCQSRIYAAVNNGVYRSGFATSQAAYDAAQRDLYVTLDELEAVLGRQRFVCGDRCGRQGVGWVLCVRVSDVLAYDTSGVAGFQIIHATLPASRRYVAPGESMPLGACACACGHAGLGCLCIACTPTQTRSHTTPLPPTPMLPLREQVHRGRPAALPHHRAL